jgi:prepilin-type processing-associated H-X9-DG protein/prepilin-type N-terminal cleavage/methylation domain-containing protein
MKRTRGFTLVEALVTLGIIVVLAALSFGALRGAGAAGKTARCLNSLRQLGTATQLYLLDHSHQFFRYRESVPEGTLWFFGLETSGGGEGLRQLDATAGPLYPYLRQVGRIEICPAFDYGDALWKPKFKGASWAYGYNWILGGKWAGEPLRMSDLSAPSQVVVFGDCAQVNTFQAPASTSHPMIEEFYLIDQSSRTVHFRHGSRAGVVFADGHSELLPPEPGTLDARLPSAQIGRIAPVGSMKYLR